MKLKKKSSPAGNRTPVFRVTGGDTHHYTTEDSADRGKPSFAQFLLPTTISR